MAKFYTPTKISENIRETPEGFLLCLGVPIARTGWQKYADGETPLEVGDDGTVDVYRSPEEVLKPAHIASYQGKSITIQHPEDFVKPDNWKELTYGVVQNPRKSDEKDEDGEDYLLADLLIQDAEAIQKVKEGLREVSCGYDAEYEQTGPGKGRQFNMIGNHSALVEKGRAGSRYAIKDHEGKVSMDPKKLIEKLKAKLGAKVVDEAMAEEKKDDKATDADSFDAIMKAVKDLSDKVDAFGKGKDEAPEKKEEDKPADKGGEPAPKKDEPAKDDDQVEKSIEDRMKAVEEALAKLAQGNTGDEEEEESEESEDSDEDDDSSITGDSDIASRAEILAPGVKAGKGQDLKKLALEKAYATDDGKKVIDIFTGGKKPTFDSADQVAMIFMGASEVLKSRRGTGLEGTKNPVGFQTSDSTTQAMTPEKMNELNAAHYGKK